jgi:hypothetical protein
MSSSNLLPFMPSEFTYSASPNPDWKFGQRIDESAEGRKWMEGEKSGWKTVDASTEDPRYVINRILELGPPIPHIHRKLYSLLVSGIVPRPVAFVSTISDTGIENLAPFRSVRLLYLAVVMSGSGLITVVQLVQPGVHLRLDTRFAALTKIGFILPTSNIRILHKKCRPYTR